MTRQARREVPRIVRPQSSFVESKLGVPGVCSPWYFWNLASLRCEMARFQREMNKKWNKSCVDTCMFSSNKFISYHGSLEWNFQSLMVNGNTVVLNHANQEIGSWRSSKSAHIWIIACLSVNTDPVIWFQEDFLAYLIVLKKHATNTLIPKEVKATPIILLKPRRQLLPLCTSQSFDTRVTEQK